MKTKFFMLLAAVLLSASAFAQSGNNGTLKGDVNGDGVVDVADINAIIQIMKDGGGTGEETKYYWYAGQIEPQDMSSNPTVDDTNFTVNKWHTLGNATTIGKTIIGGTRGLDWYVAVPTSVNLKPTASDLSTPNRSWDNLGTITVNGVSYTIWRTNSTEIRQAVYMAGTGEETKYYWYAGQTQPQNMSSNPTVDDTNFTVNKWHTLGNATTIGKTIIGGTRGLDWYVAVPTSVNLKPTASDLSTPNRSWDNLGTITVNGVSYTIWRTNSTEIRQAVYMAQ